MLTFTAIPRYSALVILLVSSSYALADELARRDVELNYSAVLENIPENAKSIDLWLPVAQDCDGQTVSAVTVSYPDGGVIDVEPIYGNRIWHKRFDAPFDDDLQDGKLGAEIRFHIHRTEIAVAEAKSLADKPKADTQLAAYLGENNLIPIATEPIKAIASELQLAKDPPIVAARKTYDWLINQFTYNYKAPGAGIGDVRWACDAKTGDCSDYHSMFIAVMRNQGIPADHEFGFPIRGKASEGRILYHLCWARFYVEGVGWIPLDASEADKHPELREYNFGSQSADLLKFTHGRDVILVPKQAGPPLNKFIHPYAEIDGAPVEKVGWSVTFKNLQN
ncbi:MAG: transglutaminase-like domain-containing protein [Candidatus Hydrogenedentes bacterium]|nr:transglutaminase-like domain-containing protein [Candidatus Hydrogenedentota bacterium]